MKFFNMITRINKSKRYTMKHISSDCECKLVDKKM